MIHIGTNSKYGSFWIGNELNYKAWRTVWVLAKLVKNDDILENDANLSVSSYVEQEDTREVINIVEVNSKLKNLVAEGNELNQKIEEIIKELG